MLKKIILITLSIVLLVGCDAATKKIAESKLKGKTELTFIGGHLRFIYVENSGGMLSIGNELPEKVKFAFFVVGVSIIVILLYGYTILKKNLNMITAAAFTLFISGGLGNLIDRIFNNGRVTDFILIEAYGFHTGIFNLADFYVTLGVITLLISEFIQNRKKPVLIENSENTNTKET